MIKVSAPTIELALLEAGKKLGVQCIDLEYEIVEMPSKGFLGFGKKDAVIVASVKQSAESTLDSADSQNLKGGLPRRFCESARNDGFLDSSLRLRSAQNDKIEETQNGNFDARIAESTLDSAPYLDSTQNLQFSQDFAHESQNLQDAESSALISQITREINDLFALLPIKINAIEVSLINKNTIYIYFTGKDSALLIGEKGYRYKALSYLLYNWINTAYGLNVRLEIESFLVSQEAMISAYLAPIIEMLKTSNEPFTTKPFDGILAYIALKELRAKLKGKSIILQSNDCDENCIVITPLKSAH